MPLPVLLLPGLDGTARLFDGLIGALPPSLRSLPVAYPSDVVLDYRALEELVMGLLPTEPFALLAESFSGPLAIRIAGRRPPGLKAVVLVATFVKSPLPGARWLRLLTRDAFFRAAPPDFAIRRWLLGSDASEVLVASFRDALSKVKARVLAARVREVFRIDVSEDLQRLRAPVLYIAGSADRLIPRRVATELRELVPTMDLATVDAPHLVLQRRPAEAAALIAEFLGRAG